jgi:hypothetical protein
MIVGVLVLLVVSLSLASVSGFLIKRCTNIYLERRSTPPILADTMSEAGTSSNEVRQGHLSVGFLGVGMMASAIMVSFYRSCGRWSGAVGLL